MESWPGVRDGRGRDDPEGLGQLLMMKLRPHHLIDIVTSFGHGQAFTPHPYGHALHAVAGAVLGNVAIEVEFVIAADDICGPCVHLRPDGRCDDVRKNTNPPESKQTHNDAMDRRILDYLDMKPLQRMTVGEFLRLVDSRTPGIVGVLSGEEKVRVSRLEGWTKGLTKLGIRERGG
jgi:hypothetical protein